MATEEKIRAVIADLLSRPKNVDFAEVVWVLERTGWTCRRRTKHSHLFTHPSLPKLQLNEHNNGKKHLPSYCVREFRDRMVELGFYE